MLNSISIKDKVKNRFICLYYNWRYHAKITIGAGSKIAIGCKLNIGRGASLTIGSHSYIGTDSKIIVHNNAELSIGNNCYISFGSVISSNSYVHIGDNCSIAHYVTIIDTNKVFSDINTLIKSQGAISNPIFIDEDNWIATGAVVLAGVSVGRHCVIAANAVVTKNFPPYRVIGGVPSKIIKYLDEQT